MTSSYLPLLYRELDERLTHSSAVGVLSVVTGQQLEAGKAKRTTYNMNLENYDSYGLVKRFQQLHEERVHTYHLFNEGHKVFLGTESPHNFVRFRQLVHEVTQEFKRISESVICIEQLLRNTRGQKSLADLIASIQEEEKNKLELTASLQLVKQGMRTHPRQPECQLDVCRIKQNLEQVVERVNTYLENIRYELLEL